MAFEKFLKAHAENFKWFKMKYFAFVNAINFVFLISYFVFLISHQLTFLKSKIACQDSNNQEIKNSYAETEQAGS